MIYQWLTDSRSYSTFHMMCTRHSEEAWELRAMLSIAHIDKLSTLYENGTMTINAPNMED